MRKLSSASRLSEAALGAVRGGDGGTDASPPPADIYKLKQHVDNPGQTAMP